MRRFSSRSNSSSFASTAESTFEVGSSIKSKSGEQHNARAINMRWRCPPESEEKGRLPNASIPTCVSDSNAARRSLRLGHPIQPRSPAMPQASHQYNVHRRDGKLGVVLHMLRHIANPQPGVTGRLAKHEHFPSLRRQKAENQLHQCRFFRRRWARRRTPLADRRPKKSHFPRPARRRRKNVTSRKDTIGSDMIYSYYLDDWGELSFIAASIFSAISSISATTSRASPLMVTTWPANRVGNHLCGLNGRLRPERRSSSRHRLLPARSNREVVWARASDHRLRLLALSTQRHRRNTQTQDETRRTNGPGKGFIALATRSCKTSKRLTSAARFSW